MRFNLPNLKIGKQELYAILGKVFLWGTIIFLILYGVYDTGRQDGKLEGYWKGYADGFFHVRPADPNLSSDEREKIQKLPMLPNSKKSISKEQNGILVKL